MDKSPEAFRTISEVAEALETPAHVLRFWETRFPQIRPVKRAGGRRYYRPSDLALLAGIRRLLHEEGMTIRGVQKILREQGVRHVAGLSEEASAEEEALISAMTTAGKPHEAEVTRLTPREANAASIDALEAEASAAMARSADPRQEEATIIAFPTDPPKEVPPKEMPVTAIDPDPRQTSFPGFGTTPDPQEALIERHDPATDIIPEGDELPEPDLTESADSAGEAEAPFIFDVDSDDAPPPGAASVTIFPQPDLSAGAEPDITNPVDVPPANSDLLPAQTLAARLRALPPLPQQRDAHQRGETLRGYAHRLAALRARLDEAQKQPL